MVVGGHAFEVHLNGVVRGYVCSTAHAPTARTDLHSAARFRLRQNEKMVAFGSRFRHDGGSGRGAAGVGAVTAVTEVEESEVETLTATDGDEQR